MRTPADHLKSFLVDLRYARNQDEEASLGRDRLAGLIRQHPSLLDDILKLAKRDNGMRRALSAARYYQGLSEQVCARIDTVLHAPFPGASGPRARPGRR